MNDTFQRHESCVHYQEAFCRCLGALLEASPQLHMFVDDTGIDKHDSTHIRYSLQIKLIMCYNHIEFHFSTGFG